MDQEKTREEEYMPIENSLKCRVKEHCIGEVDVSKHVSTDFNFYDERAVCDKLGIDPNSITVGSSGGVGFYTKLGNRIFVNLQPGPRFEEITMNNSDREMISLDTLIEFSMSLMRDRFPITHMTICAYKESKKSKEIIK